MSPLGTHRFQLAPLGEDALIGIRYPKAVFNWMYGKEPYDTGSGSDWVNGAWVATAPGTVPRRNQGD
jgi:hypothetical protein